MTCRSICFLLASMLLCAAATAASIDDVVLPDTVSINGFDRPLVLNGAGMRKKWFISVYVGALYLPQRQAGVGDLLQSPPANRVAMHFVYSKVAKRQLAEGWREGFENNLTEAQLNAVAARLDRFVGLFGDMREGETVWLDFVPGRGTEVSVNGTPLGMIEGDDFNSALLSVWLGKEPVTIELKNAMVGVDKD